VQRFYETPAPLKAGRDLISERLKFLSSQQATGISEFLPQPTGLWYRTFALKRILYFIWIHPALPRESGFPLHSNKQWGIQI